MADLLPASDSLRALALAREGLAAARGAAELLAELDAELEGALYLTAFAVELARRNRAGEASSAQRRLAAILDPVARLLTAAQAAEILGALRASGALAHEAGRLMAASEGEELAARARARLTPDELEALGDRANLAVLRRETGFVLQAVHAGGLLRASALAELALERAQAWAEGARGRGGGAFEAGAARFAQALGRALELALLARAAQEELEGGREGKALAAVRRLAARGAVMPLG